VNQPATHPTVVACDESGFTGGNLTFAHAVFTHASVLVSREAAAEETARLRRRVAAHGELKASWLLRWCDRDDLVRLLGPGGLLDGALVHLSDIRLFLLRRLADVLMGPEEISGLDLPGATAATRAAALDLRRHGEASLGAKRWQEFLMVAGNALRTNSRWVPATAVDDLEAALDVLLATPATRPVRGVLASWRSATGRVRAVRRQLEDDPRLPPLLEPLLPAVTHAALAWSAQHPALLVHHDEQSALTRWRVAAIGERVAARFPGNAALELVRVDSRDDPRVQVADLVAGIARRAATSVLDGKPDADLVSMVRPLVDDQSIWDGDADGSADAVPKVTAELSPR